MPKKKLTWADFQKGKEYEMWGRLFEMAKSMNLTGASFISCKESGSGVYWEPFFVLLFKFGNMLKQTGKLKEIKMDWIRPLNYLESQSNEKVYYDNDLYIVPKGASGNAVNARLALQHLLDSVNTYDTLDEQNFQKTYKTLHSDSSYFFKQLNIFIKDGFRELHENIKLILKPLRMLRKSGYRLFSLEKFEAGNQDLTVFEDKKDAKEFVKGIQKWMQSEEYKTKRDTDLTKLDNYLGIYLKQDFYQYKFTDKKRVSEEEEEEEEEKKEKEKEIIKQSTKKQQMSQEELLAKKNEEDRKNLTYINIKELQQNPPSRPMKEALQVDFEAGIDAMYKHLNIKLPKDFPFEIEAHKIFVNLNKIPDGRKRPETEFYLGQLASIIEILKIKCYEMKLNGLARILIPISLNTDLIILMKNLYNTHEVIDRVLGDKLLYDQYVFLFSRLEMVSLSSLGNELSIVKDSNLIEKCIPKYLFFESLRHSAEVLNKMISFARTDGGHFDINNFYQPTKHVIDSEDNLVINCYELKESLKKGLTEELQEKSRILWAEIKQFGRFWLLEGFFSPEERNSWLEAIEILATVNVRVQEDMRDMILLDKEEIFRKEAERGDEPNAPELVTERKGKGSSTASLSQVKKEEKKEAMQSEKNLHLAKRSSKILKNQKTVKNTLGARSQKKRKSRKESIDSKEDDIVSKLPDKLDNLRPPLVWNYPIERITKMKNEELIKQNKELPKPEIRKANPFKCYHDQRIEKFMDVFNKIYKSAIDYNHHKGNSWEFLYEKLLNVLHITYKFKPVIVEKKEEETKEGETTTGEQKTENGP